jgi:4-amino-4-deoxy-L-arabinose transferase-like glycosyltransferase
MGIHGQGMPHMNDQEQDERHVIQPTGLLRQDIEGENVILYRSKRFFVRTVNDPKQRKHPLRERSGGNTSMLGGSFIDQMHWITAEKLRLTREPTRLLPDVETLNPSLAKATPIPLWLEGLVVIIALALVAAVHGFNMFNYPIYGQNEGTLMANAWAILHGKLEPYTYTYDQPPLGWLQLAAWLSMSGGFFAFGNAINSGRVFMLVLSLASTLLVMLITRRLSGSRSAGLIAMLLYGLSPLSIVFQRQVLLENIGTFWLLLALYFLVTGNSRQRALLFAALALGIAILTKLAFVVFLPVMVYIAWLHSTKFQRKFATVLFLYVILSLISFYALLAALKGELFPMGWLPLDHHAHPSLISSLLLQVMQASNGNTFTQSLHGWMNIDQPFILVGSGAVAVNLLLGCWKRLRLQWMPALLALSFSLFLLRGSLVYPFFIIPLLPLIAMNIALAINTLLRLVTAHVGVDLGRAVVIFALIGALIPFNIQMANASFILQPTTVQNHAMLWVRDNVPHSAVVITDSTFYTDLHEQGGEGVGDGAVFSNVYIYWNVARDPAIYSDVLHDNWNAIDYLVVDSQMLHDIQSNDRSMLLLNRTLHHSMLIATFHTDNSSQGETIQIYQVMHMPS